MPLPPAFIEKYQTLLGSESEAFFHALEQDSTSGFRLNPLKPNAETVRDEWITDHFPNSPYATNGYLGSIHGHTPLHQAGYVYSQEPSASLVATVAQVQPGERVLDLCAAPGGKTTQLATAMRDQGLLVANEIVPKRARILSENVERWGLTHTVVTNHAPEELARIFPAFFDCIVVDAPCSGEGMFRKNPTAQDEWTIETPEMCATRQREILQEAVKMLNPGGRLVYSTCTFAPEEDEMIVSYLVQENDFQIDRIDLAKIPHSHGRSEWGTVDHLEETIRLWPHRSPGEGHFMARLIAPTVAQYSTKRRPFRATKPTSEQLALLKPFPALLAMDPTLQYHVIKQELWAIPTDLPETAQKLRVKRWGLDLGTFKKGRFEPNFAWAMSIKDTAEWPTVALSDEEWIQYVHGDAIAHPGNAGWLLLTYHAMPVGFGKQTQNLIKNFYPKGLRFMASPDHLNP
ncbi:MAG: RsmF rRNA methyltransferase first C-terminal domain-containing protein [Aerococcus sp.]|nr:RsmF rRNA methyltransferase first C-terminal domain-containing protein [Aerococcus sp.]